MLHRSAIAIAALPIALSAAADVRLSPEGGSHTYPAVCRQPDGFVVAWESDAEQGREVTVQRLDDSGQATGDRFRANQENVGDQQLPDIACRADGSFLVVWESRDQDGDGLGVFARNFAGDGTPQSDEIQVNDHTADNQRRPRVCAYRDGRALIVWDSANQDGDGTGIYSRHLNGNGAPIGAERKLNKATEGDFTEPAAGCDAAGRAVIAWTAHRAEGSDIFSRFMDADGNLDDLEIRLSSGEPGVARHVSLWPFPNEAFVFAHEAANGDVAVGVAYYDDSGMGLTMRPLLLDRRNEGPSVAASEDGSTYVTWSRGDGFAFEVAGLMSQSLFTSERLATLNGERTGNDGATSPFGRGVDIAAASDGPLVVWQKRDIFADDSSSAIYARRFRDCIGDCSDDGLVAINELITGVRIALNESAVESCSRLDANGSGAVEINELVRAVNEALARICPAPAN